MCHYSVLRYLGIIHVRIQRCFKKTAGLLQRRNEKHYAALQINCVHTHYTLVMYMRTAITSKILQCGVFTNVSCQEPERIVGSFKRKSEIALRTELVYQNKKYWPTQELWQRSITYTFYFDMRNQHTRRGKKGTGFERQTSPIQIIILNLRIPTAFFRLKQINYMTGYKEGNTRWFKYDRDKL